MLQVDTDPQTGQDNGEEGAVGGMSPSDMPFEAIIAEDPGQEASALHLSDPQQLCFDSSSLSPAGCSGTSDDDNGNNLPVQNLGTAAALPETQLVASDFGVDQQVPNNVTVDNVDAASGHDFVGDTASLPGPELLPHSGEGALASVGSDDGASGDLPVMIMMCNLLQNQGMLCVLVLLTSILLYACESWAFTAELQRR